MKILGIGVDLVQNSRIKNVLSKSHVRRFLNKVLHEQQLSIFDALKTLPIQTQYVASRWAVKQATIKAIGRRTLIFNQMKIIKDQYGRPQLQLCSQQNKQIVGQLNVDKIFISLAHEDDYTTAYALATLK